MQQKQALAAIARYMMGTIDLQEEHALRHWVDADPAHSALFEACYLAWDTLESSGLDYNPDVDAGWESLLATQQTTPAATKSSLFAGIKPTRSWWLGLGLLITIGLTWYGMTRRSDVPVSLLEWKGEVWQKQQEVRWEQKGDSLQIADQLWIWPESREARIEVSESGQSIAFYGISGRVFLLTEHERFLLTPGIRLVQEAGIWIKTSGE